MTLQAVSEAAERRQSAEAAYRSAVVAAATDHGLSETARAAGVTRQAVAQLVKRARTDVERDRSRLAEIDARYESLVDAIAAREDPAGLMADQRIRNGQAKRLARKGLGRLPTVREEIRDLAEAKLLRLLDDRREDPVIAVIAAIVAELDEAAAIRERLSSLLEARAF